MSAGVAFAQFELEDAPEEEPARNGQVVLGFQAVDDSGDVENLQDWGDGLDDPIVVEYLRYARDSERGFFALEGRDIGQRDQDLGLAAGIHGRFRIDVGWDEQFRNYSNGRFLGTRAAPGYWAVPDAVQGLLEPGFLPQNGNPTAAGQAALRGLLAGAPEVALEQHRTTGGVSLAYVVSPKSTLRAGFSRQNRDGLRAISNGSYARTATGATAIGGLGENFRAFGLELPMPIDYETDVVNLGLDYRADSWFVDFGFTHTSFQNNVGSLVFDNPLLLNSQNNRVGGAAMRQIDLAPDWDGSAVLVSAGLSDLPLGSRLTLTYANDNVTQDDPFLPYSVNTALRDNRGNPVATRALPARDLDGDVTTGLFNAVLSSRPGRDFATNLRFNRYDYDNESDAILWDGFAAVGESSWRDYDGTNAARLPYRNRVPEYTRTRAGADASYHFSAGTRLIGEVQREDFERNADRYADTSEDSLGLTLSLRPTDNSTLRLAARRADRDIDGEYAAHLENGIQEEWEELRMFDQAARERTRFDVDFGVDVLESTSIGLSASRFEDTYDEEFYGLNDFEGFSAGIDVSWAFGSAVAATAYYNLDVYESNQRNRAKSDRIGAGSFAVPENDFDTYIEDETDSYGVSLQAVLVPDKWSLRLAWDRSDSVGRIETTNPNLVPGVTTSGATAFAWPDTEVQTDELVLALNYQWSDTLTAGLRYTWLRQDLSDFAADLTRDYFGSPTDLQGNNPSHFVFMDAHPFDYEAHVVTATLTLHF